MAIAIALVASAAISAYSSYAANKSASKKAEQARQDAANWKNQVVKAADPFLKGSMADYGVLSNATGVNGQAGMQSYLDNSINPLLGSAQNQALTALNQKYAAMGYGPMTGNQIAAGNNLMQTSYLDQYNKQVAQLSQIASQKGSIGANMYGVAGQALNAQTQAALASAQYSGQAIAGAGNAVAQGISGLATGYASGAFGTSGGAAAGTAASSIGSKG